MGLPDGSKRPLPMSRVGQTVKVKNIQDHKLSLGHGIQFYTSGEDDGVQASQSIRMKKVPMIQTKITGYCSRRSQDLFSIANDHSGTSRAEHTGTS